VEDGETGYLVEPRDPKGMAHALKRLLRNDELRRRMGDAARVRARERFGVDRMVRRTVELYERLLTAPQGRQTPRSGQRESPWRVP